MTKRYLLPVALCFLFGLLFSFKNLYGILFPFLVLEVYIFLRFYKYDMKVQGFVLIGLLFSTFLFAILYGEKIIEKREEWLSRLESDQEITVQGHLYKKETRNERYYLYLDEGRLLLDEKPVPCGKIMVVSDSLEYTLGNVLVVKGRYKEFRNATNEGGYDEKEIYFSKGIFMKVESLVSVSEYGEKNSFREVLYRVREKMKAVMSYYLRDKDAGVLSAVVLGDKTELSIEDKEAYANAGISHILSISGLHVSLLCMGLFKILRKRRIPMLLSAIVSMAFSVGYCFFSGAGISTIRAVGMFITAMLAMVLGEAYDLISSLSFLGILILVQNPEALFSAGFLLSFSAVIGIAVTGEELMRFYEVLAERRDFLRKRRRELSEKRVPKIYKALRRYFDDFEKMILLNLGIFITTFPFVLWFYYEIPTLSLVINILVLPLMGIFLGLGFLGSLLGCINFSLGYLIKPCGVIAEFYRLIAENASSNKFSKWVIGKPSEISIVCYFVVLSVFLLILKCVRKEVDVMTNAEGEKLSSDIRRFNIYNAFFTFGVVGTIFLLVCVIYTLNIRKPCIKMLDVGQGDGIYVRTTSGDNIFIDGGSSSVKQVGKYNIAPFLKCVGAGTIDCWVISHTDEDHVSGLIELLEDGYNVKNIVMSKFVIRNEKYEEIKNLCDQQKIKIIYLVPGDILDFGEEKMTCLYPYSISESGNDSSLVMFYESKDCDALFTGDMGREQEKALMKEWEWPKDGKKHILKVAHHGSRNSSDEAFIERCNPDISIISAGKYNSYGHPHKETLEILDSVHSIVKRTDIEGEIILE